MKKSKDKEGFTLIELSIVLVIIGLLVGGIFVGQDLIKAAAVRHEINELVALETQINTFYGKYQCLPGDCYNATTYFGNTDARGHTVLNGNGDGIIQSQVGPGAPYSIGQCLSGYIAGEVSQVFLQLDDAGLSSYPADGSSGNMGVSYPESSLGGTGLIVSCLANADHTYNQYYAAPLLSTLVNTIVLGIYPQNSRILYVTNPGTLSPGIPVDTANLIDQKMDDGLPFTGLFSVFAPYMCCAPYICCGSNNYPALGTSSIKVTPAKILH